MDAVVFQVGTRRCALELHHVEEVIRLGPITPVPSSAAAVVGAMNLRGEVVAVLDPRALVGEPAPTVLASIGLLSRAGGCHMVLCVERVEGVVPIAELGSSAPSVPQPTLLDLEALLRGLIQQLQRGTEGGEANRD